MAGSALGDFRMMKMRLFVLAMTALVVIDFSSSISLAKQGNYPLGIRKMMSYIMGYEHEAPNDLSVFQAVPGR